MVWIVKIVFNDMINKKTAEGIMKDVMKLCKSKKYAKYFLTVEEKYSEKEAWNII